MSVRAAAPCTTTRNHGDGEFYLAGGREQSPQGPEDRGLRNWRTKRRVFMASTPEIANEGSIPGVALGGRQPSGSSTAGRAFGVYFMAAAPTLDRARATRAH
jgi:hypothetical protein